MDPVVIPRVRDDLQGLLRGQLLFDNLSRALYSTDASPFLVEPLGVAVPLDVEDVQTLVRYAAENAISLIPRGAGTGLAGESLGAGLLVDLSKHFRNIVDVGSDQVRVEAGVSLRDLSSRLAQDGRRFAPDPALSDCTLGGMLATNASGSRALLHGTTREHVLQLTVVLDNGDCVEVGRESRRPAEKTNPRLVDLVGGVATLLEQHAGLIQANPPRTRFDRCGYAIHDTLGPDYVDLARLLVGSEGTLGLFTAATLRTIPLAGGRASVLLAFPTLDGALRAALQAASTGPAACELLDRRLLRLARGADPDVAALVPQNAEAVLLVECEGDSPDSAARAAALLAGRCGRGERLAGVQLAAGEDEVSRFWRVRDAALPGLYTLRGGTQPLPFVEDVGVPPPVLGEYLRRVQEILQRHELTASFLVHAATGQVHMRPFMNMQQPGEPGRMWLLADEVYGLVLELGGTITAQHGTGLARSPWVARQAGPLYPVYRDLKTIFDPRGLFNPGKIVGATAGNPWPTRPTRAIVPPLPIIAEKADDHAEKTAPPPRPQTALSWAPGALSSEVLSCTGCGECRTTDAAKRMCPIFRATHSEAATPRAKANLLAHLLGPEGDLRRLAPQQVREVADLCVNCKMCARECPSQTDIPRLMLETKAAYVAEQGLDRADWISARIESVLRLGSAIAPLTNALLGNRPARWLLEKLLGLSRLRRLPRFAHRSFLSLAQRRGWTRKPRSGRPRVAYFVDVFANYLDPSLAEAVVSVLHRNGVEVYVPPQQWGCGMAPLAQGDVETARETVQHNLRVLADLARDGFPIVCSEPSAALMLRKDALDLLDDSDARLVASRTVEFTTYLRSLQAQAGLRTDFLRLDLTLGHHVPCHLKALGDPPAAPALLALIPGLRVRTIDVSCSGMAGMYGLRAMNRANSLAAGKPMLDELGRPGVLFGSTECGACRLQMEDSGNKRTLHPAQYLALAYGGQPELLNRLRRPIGDLSL